MGERRRMPQRASAVLAFGLLTLSLLASGGSAARAVQGVAAKPGTSSVLPRVAGLDARVDPRLAQTFSIEARSASLAALSGQLGGALEIPVSVDPELANQRITLHAARASVLGLQAALASLTRGSWQRVGEPPQHRYLLHADDALAAEAESLRRERRVLALRSFLSTSDALRRRGPEWVASEMRASLAARMPYLPEESLRQISPDFVRLTLLVQPLRLGIGRVVAENGSAWVPFAGLPQQYQELFASFYLEARNRPAAAADNGILEYAPEEVLSAPQARVEYRFVYGDNWTGPLLTIRVGAGDHWATAVLPTVLYELPDYARLFPAAASQRPAALDQFEPVRVLVDTDSQTWDQAITSVARAAKINIVADAFPRPPAFRPAGKGPVIAATTLQATLDDVCRYYGYVWWRHGEFFVFKHRFWAEEQRVSVPEPLEQRLGAEASATGRLSDESLRSLAALTDEQLLSMHLNGTAAGRVAAPMAAFDLNEIQLARSGLLIYSQLDAASALAARTKSLQVAAASPGAQYVFATTGDDRGFPLDDEGAALWRFRLTPETALQRLPAGTAQVGSLRFAFDFGPAGIRTTRLALRLPHVEPPAAPNPPPAMPVPPPDVPGGTAPS